MKKSAIYAALAIVVVIVIIVIVSRRNSYWEGQAKYEKDQRQKEKKVLDGEIETLKVKLDALDKTNEEQDKVIASAQQVVVEKDKEIEVYKGHIDSLITFLQQKTNEHQQETETIPQETDVVLATSIPPLTVEVYSRSVGFSVGKDSTFDADRPAGEVFKLSLLDVRYLRQKDSINQELIVNQKKSFDASQVQVAALETKSASWEIKYNTSMDSLDQCLRTETRCETTLQHAVNESKALRRANMWMKFGLPISAAVGFGIGFFIAVAK